MFLTDAGYIHISVAVTFRHLGALILSRNYSSIVSLLGLLRLFWWQLVSEAIDDHGGKDFSCLSFIDLDSNVQICWHLSALTMTGLNGATFLWSFLRKCGGPPPPSMVVATFLGIVYSDISGGLFRAWTGSLSSSMSCGSFWS